MNGRIAKLFLLSILTTVCSITGGCNNQKAELVIEAGTVAYLDSTAEFPRLVFADGQVSQNDRCMVRMAKLNYKMPPMYVNGKPVGFC